MAVTSKGAQQHRTKKHLRVDWEATFGRSLDDLDLDSQEFRFTAIRPDITNVSLDDYIEQVTWTDEGNQYNLNTIPVLRGTLTWRADDPDLPGGVLHLGDGHRIRCEVKWIGTWMPLWEMRITKPPSLALEDGTQTVDLADDMELITAASGWVSSVDLKFRYVKTRKRPNGWRYDEIVADVCRRFDIRLASLPRGHAQIKNFDVPGISPGEAIRQAVVTEQEYSGQKMLIAWRYQASRRRFALHVSSLRRNPVLYTLADEIRNVTVEPIRRAQFATRVVAHGSGKKNGKSVHYKPVTVSSPAGIKRYGLIERHVKVPGIASGQGDLRRKAKHELYKQMQPVRNITTLVTYGIATVRRGDALRISLPDQGYKGDAGIVFVTSVEHTLTPSDYTMSLTLQRIDPLDPNRVRKDREDALKRLKSRKKGKHK